MASAGRDDLTHRTTTHKELPLWTTSTPTRPRARAKEAAGSLTDDDKLKREGQADQAKASLKDSVDKVADKAKNRPEPQPVDRFLGAAVAA